MTSHAAQSPEVPEKVLLIIADISGYTRYMAANAKTLAHSQTIITELIKTIIRTVELPLEVAKLEGDAVFFFCRKGQGSKPWSQAKGEVGGKLLEFFRMFSERLRELSESTICNCKACTHIETLRLKVVVHSGEALFHQVFNFLELAGIDVILVHRLLKNSVKEDQYLLLTEAARLDLEFAGQTPLVTGSETYEGIGKVETAVYLPGGQVSTAREMRVPFPERFGSSWRLFWNLWFAPFAPPRRHASAMSGVGKAARMSFAGLTALLTPIFLPLGLVFVFIHALKPRTGERPRIDDHEHRSDGSCCRGV